MAISLIKQDQIDNFRSPTGIYTPSGWVISGNIGITGAITGQSGNFNTLTVNGPLISPYLSGIVGTTITGSGIIEFVSVPDVSGGNIHFRTSVHTGDRNFLIQAFSSQDSQEGWFYFTSGGWNNFPAIGLSTNLQSSSLVRKIYSPTGMNVYQKYFADLQTIYAGNVTGAVTNSVQFQSPTQGFTALQIPFVGQFADSADARYARKLAIGSDSILSGVKVSGLPLVIPTFAGIPATNHGTGTVIVVSGLPYIYHERVGFSGYQAVATFTGLAIATGGVITDSKPIFSGQGQIGVSLQGTNIVAISGGGVNTFAIASGPTRQGNLILSGEGGLGLRTILTTSGTVIAYSGGAAGGGGGVGNVTGIGAASAPVQTGLFSFSGASNITVFQQTTSSGTNIVVSGLPYAVTGLGITGNPSTFIQGAIALIPTGGVNITYSGNNIVIGNSPSSTNITNNSYFLSGTQGIVSAGLSGIPQFTGSLGLSGLGNISISLVTGDAAYGFSGLYLISGSGGGGGGISTQDVVHSFFLDFPFTGSGISESFYPKTWTFTGVTLACTVTGSGRFPMSGNIYQRDTSNARYNIATFTLDSNVLFKISGSPNVTITGQHRIGFDITNNLSGIKNLSIGLFGTNP